MPKKVCVIGLGYVGLPLANLCAKKGYEVYGLDIDKERVDKINKTTKGVKATTDSSVINDSDVVIVCVPTPVDKAFHPDLKPLVSATDEISKFMKKGQIIIIESTVNPNVTERIIKPILEMSKPLNEKSRLKEGKDFYLAHCPERIDPGNKKWDVSNISRVVGGVSKISTKKSAEFYRSIINAEILELKSSNEAEAVKIMENTFRDVNIAFINEMAISFDKLGLDIMEVIKGASTKPFAFMPHYPGCGVGGLCIPHNPNYMIDKGKEEGFDHRFLSLARVINNSMPNYTVQRTIEGLNEVGSCVKDTHILVLGIAYKRDVDDIKYSPAFDIISQLKKLGANVKAYDPYVPSKSDFQDLNSALAFAECIVLATDHSEFKKLTGEKLRDAEISVVIDGRNFFDKKDIESYGIIYKGIGR